MIGYSKLSRTGIGNKLFIWAQGFVFSQVNNCKHITLGWTKFHIGPILRGENSLRLYLDYVHPLKSFYHSFLLLFYSIYKKKIMLKQDDCINLRQKDCIYTFHTLPSSDNYFFNLSPFRQNIKASLYEYLSKSITKRIEQYEKPFIGVHIRLGDYKWNGIVTPIQYYINNINIIRATVGKDLPVTIFTDGKKEEIADILALPYVTLAKDDKDIVHLLLLSQSKIIIMTSISTFGQWAGFLSDDAILIYDKKIIKTAIRPELNFLEGEITDVENALKRLR